MTSRLDFFSVFHRAGKGHAVSEANIAADGDTAADAGDLDAGRFDETGEIESRGFAFRIGVRCKDDFLHRLILQAFQKLFDLEIFRADTIQRGERAMQYVIRP